MPKFNVFLEVEEENIQDAVLGILYPDGEPTKLNIKSITVEADPLG